MARSTVKPYYREIRVPGIVFWTLGLTTLAWILWGYPVLKALGPVMTFFLVIFAGLVVSLWVLIAIVVVSWVVAIVGLSLLDWD